MKKIIAALLLIFAGATYANEPWTVKELEQPKYWDSYPTKFTQKFAQSCLNDYDNLAENTAMIMCVCVVWNIENFISYEKLMKSSKQEGVQIIRAANKVCKDLILK